MDRETLKRNLIEDPSRKVLGHNHEVYTCEPQGWVPHTCQGGFEMHEVIFPRQKIRLLKPKDQDYFWDERNCVIACSWIHPHLGNPDFRRWFIRRVEGLYTREVVWSFVEDALLKTHEELINLRSISPN